MLLLTPALNAAGIAKPLTGEHRRDCARAQPAAAAAPRQIVKACLVWTESAGRSSNSLVVTDQSGNDETIDVGAPVYPWADVHLLPRIGAAQWLVVIYKSEGDRQDGRTFFAEVYAAHLRRKIFEAYATDARIEHLDKTSGAHLILHERLASLHSAIQLGWPRVYQLGEVLTSVPLARHPAVAAAFVEYAGMLASRLEFVCREEPKPCPYSTDLELIAAQVVLARAAMADKAR